MALGKSLPVKRPRYRGGKDNSWMAPVAARHPNATRTIIIVCVVCGVGVVLALLGVAGYRVWVARKSKRKSTAAAAEKEDSAMLQENREVAEQAQMLFDNPRPSLLSNSMAGSKSRKQAASATSREP